MLPRRYVEGWRPELPTDDSIFPYLTLPAACVTGLEPPLPPGSLQELRRYIEVSKTDSLEWGDDATAAKRACIEPKVTDSNKELFRTHHPFLSKHQVVRLFEEEPNHNLIWLVETEGVGNHMSTHAGGIGIHIIPDGFQPYFPVIGQSWALKQQWDPLTVTLNPRKFLARNHLHLLREMFPSSVGVRLFVSGCIVVLFKDRADIEKSWDQDGYLDAFGTLRVRYDVLDITPTKEIIPSGAAVKDITRPAVYAKMGLKLRLPRDTVVITNPQGLPDMEAPKNTACVTGWGRYEDLTAGNPIFLTGNNIQSDRVNPRHGTGVSTKAQKAIHEGTQYIWHKAALGQSFSILWRTEDDVDSVSGYSGSVLCLGEPQHKTCLAVCFQNFEFRVPSRLLRDDCRLFRLFPKHANDRIVVKGGFLLPDEIRESEILC